MPPRRLAAILVTLLAPPLADATPWRVAAEVDVGNAGTTGPIGGELDGSLVMYLGLSGELAGVVASVHGGYGMLTSQVPERDDSHLFLLELGASVGVRLPVAPRLTLVPRLGLATDWLRGGRQVQRTCDQTGACDGGFYREVPSYRSTGPTLALRLEYGGPHAPLAGAVALTLGYQRLAVELPGAGEVDGGLLSLTLGCAFGASGP
jgi:hypothetical protein